MYDPSFKHPMIQPKNIYWQNRLNLIYFSSNFVLIITARNIAL